MDTCNFSSDDFASSISRRGETNSSSSDDVAASLSFGAVSAVFTCRLFVAEALPSSSTLVQLPLVPSPALLSSASTATLEGAISSSTGGEAA